MKNETNRQPVKETIEGVSEVILKDIFRMYINNGGMLVISNYNGYYHELFVKKDAQELSSKISQLIESMD